VLNNPFSQLDVYLATYPDRMHHLDLGLFNYQVIYTREMLKNLCGQVAVDELDKRLAAIPRFPGLKIFKNGLENIKRFTADEYRNMMKVFLFIIEGIIIKHKKTQTERNTAKKI
jgi:predicted oxidoreductase